MGILDKLGFKRKPGSREYSPPGKQEAQVEVKPTKAVPPKRKTSTSRAYRILLRPILSEKGTHLAGSGKYVFAVNPRANKSEIKKSIERVYDVNVKAVKIIKLPGKKRRYGRTRGMTSAWKKAIITVRPGEKIPGIIESVG